MGQGEPSGSRTEPVLFGKRKSISRAVAKLGIRVVPDATYAKIAVQVIAKQAPKSDAGTTGAKKTPAKK